MTNRHLCNADSTKGPVCSHLATDEVLGALGHPVRLVVKGPFGTPIVEREGAKTRGKAVHAAWAEGTVRICNRSARLEDDTLGAVPTFLRKTLS